MVDRIAREERYARQTRFSPIGAEGQRQLGAHTVLIAGAGALGASLAQHMVRAGVGAVRLVDRDYVEPSNLQRQTLFDESDARQALPKVVAAADKLRRINADVRIEAIVANIGAVNVDALLDGVDLALDGTDNVQTRLVLGDACFARGIPLVYGGVAGSEGMSAALVPGETACLRCLIGGERGPEDRTCDTAGVIGPAVEAAAALQAAEALKWLSGNGSDMRRSLVSLDVWRFAVRESRLPAPQRDCAVCGPTGARPGREQPEANANQDGVTVTRRRPVKPEAGTEEAAAVLLCGRGTVQVTFADSPPSLAEASRAMQRAGGELVVSNPYLRKWALPGGERIVLFEGGRALVQGTTDERRAAELCLTYLREGREARWAE